MLNSKSPALRRISLVSAVGTRRDAAPHTCGGNGVVLGRGVCPKGTEEEGGRQPKRNLGGDARCAWPSPAWLRLNIP